MAKPQSPAGSAGPTTETPKPTAELIKCKDLLPKAQVAALGFDVSKYDDEAAQSRPDRGCMCSFGKLGQEHVNATLFPGHTYRVLTEEQKKSKPKDKLMAMVAPTYVDGPAVGAHSQWYERSNFKGLMFLGENKRYWVNIGSKDEETVMKVAKLLQANMSKR